MSHNDTLSCEQEPQILYDMTAVAAKRGEGQCDCACPTTVRVKSQRPTTSSENYSLRMPFETIRVTANYYAVVRQEGSPIIMNDSALAIAERFLTPQPLSPPTKHQITIAKLVTLGILAPADCPPVNLVETPTTLAAWLHITDRCNLRCVYCYLPHKSEDMSLKSGLTAVAATFRSAVKHNYHQVKLKYAGGEPLICFATVVALHHHAQTLAERHQLALDGVILSNGTLLTPEKIKIMKSLGLRLMVSLDGLEDSHNSHRIYPNGRGSFVHTVRGIELAMEHGLVPDISVTVSNRNARFLPDLIAWILERDLPFSINFYRQNHLSAKYTDLKLEEEQIITGMQAAFKVIETHLPERSLLASLVDRASLSTPHLRTCGVGHSYLVFSGNGRVSKCQMQQQQSVTDAHAEDPLALIRTDEIGIQNISVNGKEDCQSCQWQYWCTGGCPLATYRATGRYDIKSPNCNIYKALYPEAIRLEGLRLLKYSDSSKFCSY